MSDATSLHHCLKNKQLKLNAFSGKDPARGIFKKDTKDKFLIILYVHSVLSGCLSMPDATSLLHCLQNYHQYYIIYILS